MSKRAKTDEADAGSAPPRAGDVERLATNHLRFGWWALLVFLSLGIVLELLHGFKIGAYLDTPTRRHMWTLAHTHGTLLALIHLAFAASIPRLNTADKRWRQIASPCLYSATLTLPAGFFMGGIYIYSGDPGFGILLVPVGAFLLLAAVWLIALAVQKP
jgi:hypothetical protein